MKQLTNLVEKVNNENNKFGNKGECKTYLENYYTKLRAPATKEVNEKTDKMLLDKLKISFLNSGK